MLFQQHRIFPKTYWGMLLRWQGRRANSDPVQLRRPDCRGKGFVFARSICFKLDSRDKLFEIFTWFQYKYILSNQICKNMDICIKNPIKFTIITLRWAKSPTKSLTDELENSGSTSYTSLETFKSTSQKVKWLSLSRHKEGVTIFIWTLEILWDGPYVSSAAKCTKIIRVCFGFASGTCYVRGKMLTRLNCA